MLTRSQVAFLRARAHGRKPIVRIGQRGLTDTLVAELDRALRDHELVKIRVGGGDRATRSAYIDAVSERTGAEVVQRIGATASLYRRNPDNPRIQLPR